jgi:hypothetical protein
MADDPIPTELGDRSGAPTEGADAKPRQWRGTSRAYLLRRLREAGRDDLVEAVEARRISARAAAIGLGWLQEHLPPPDPNDAKSKRRAFAMTAAFGGSEPDRLAVLCELSWGANQTGSVFRDRAALEQAWEQFGDEILADYSPGRRPLGWWCVVAPEELCRDFDHDREKSLLYERGFLGIDEMRGLEAEWREGFVVAQVRCKTEAERKHFYREIDLPESLRAQWTTELRQRVRAGRKARASATGAAP